MQRLASEILEMRKSFIFPDFKVTEVEAILGRKGHIAGGLTVIIVTSDILEVV
jgi:hypothetical protein